MAVLFLILLSVSVILLIIRSIKKPYNYPPGPSWLPIVGCQPIFKKRLMKHAGAMYLGLQELADEYNTNILGLKLGKDQIICVFGYERVKEVLTNDDFAGRPDGFFLRLRTFGMRKGITFTDGPVWHEQRSFVMRHLRDVGFGKKSMELKIINECQDLIQFINENGPDINMEEFFAPSVLSVLWDLTAGRSLDRNDDKLKELLALLKRRLKAFDLSGGLLGQMPWLRFIIPEKSGFNLVTKLNEQMRNFFMEAILEHHATFTGDDSDLIYAFIQEMKIQQKEEKKDSTFTNDQLLAVCLDLFIAGSQTTNSLSGFLFYNLLCFPDIKVKILKEIDANIPKSRMPELADRVKLPYLEAFIMETRRMQPIAGVAGPRRVLHNYQMDKYLLAKDVTVLISIWSVHMDKEYWKDPEVFRPERFIGKDGLFYPNERILNFGLGKRRCPGEALAKDCIFLFFASILQKFDVLPVSNIPLPLKRAYAGITMTPDPFSIRFVNR
uniref:Cytochrome P450 CYP305W2 n=1 Tax=Chrysoperla zastrowi sillemi TaxID=482137 RepID=A0A9E8BWN1_9NEOP|nr:cytochrome P450 CYP305W2 [Chrysoperla zastrowi sillemi]